jgi:hypothetical protein
LAYHLQLPSLLYQQTINPQRADMVLKRGGTDSLDSDTKHSTTHEYELVKDVTQLLFHHCYKILQYHKLFVFIYDTGKNNDLFIVQRTNCNTSVSMTGRKLESRQRMGGTSTIQ